MKLYTKFRGGYSITRPSNRYRSLLNAITNLEWQPFLYNRIVCVKKDRNNVAALWFVNSSNDVMVLRIPLFRDSTIRLNNRYGSETYINYKFKRKIGLGRFYRNRWRYRR